MAERPRTEFVEMLKRLAECPEFIVNGFDTVGPAPDGQSADVHLFVNGERVKVYMQGPPQMYEVLDFAEAAREWLPQLLAERDRLQKLVLSQEWNGLEQVYSCPWCSAQYAREEDARPHEPHCEAFSARGVVR